MANIWLSVDSTKLLQLVTHVWREDPHGKLVDAKFVSELRTRLIAHDFEDGDKVTHNLQTRLENANSFFHRKAAEVLTDELAVEFLAELFEKKSINIEEVDLTRYAIAVSRVAAANFCEVGAGIIWITDAGWRFIDAIDKAVEDVPAEKS